MDNKGKVKLKSCKKRDRGSLSKPDVILITKDVMVPVRVPLTAQNCLKTNLGTEKALRLNAQSLKSVLSSEGLHQTDIKESLPQVRKNSSEKKMGQETVSESAIQSPFRADVNRNTVYVDEREAVSLEMKDLGLRSNSQPFDLASRDEGGIKSVNISQIDRPVTSRNSTGSLTTSADTYSSSQSLTMIEDSLPKLPCIISLSSGSESNISASDRKALSEYRSSALRNNNNHNSSTREESDVDEPFADRENDPHEKETVNTDAEINFFEEHLIMIDVECFLQSLLANLETVDNFSSFQNSEEIIDPEKKSLRDATLNFRKDSSIKKSDCKLNERIPKMVEFRYSLHDLLNTVSPFDNNEHSCTERVDIDSERKYSWQELDLKHSAINSNHSNDQIEVKYSWQIITPRNQESNDVTDQTEDRYAKNSKQTSTEDLCPNELEFRYSWQKLTSKYLAGKHTEDSLSNTNQPTISDIPNKMSSMECVEECSPPRETYLQSSHMNTNLRREETSKAAEDIGRVLRNSPLNNIISSMLPEIKLINRRISFNDTSPEIIGTRRDSYLKSHEGSNFQKFSTPYSSVSSIKHVIENLNEMVKSQKDMFKAHMKNQELDKNSKSAEPSVNPVQPVEKVEIFPSTLHVLGNYIVRDIRPADMNDQRSLLDSNNYEMIEDHLLSDNSIPVQNTRLCKPVENVLNEKIRTRSKDSWSQSPDVLKLENSDFPRLLGHPVSFNSDCYPAIFTTDEIFSPVIKKPRKNEPSSLLLEDHRSSLLLPVLENDRILTEKNWEPAIADMEELIGLSLGTTHCMNEGKDDGNKAVPHTKNTGPLKPRVEVSFSETKEAAGDSKSRKDELLARLEGAMNRLKQSEEHVDANWNLDYSVLDVDDSISDNEVQLPKQVEDHIRDIIKSAEEYLAKLEEQLKDLRSADDQIINSSERTFKDIDESYQIFMDNLCQEINKRRNLVRLETEVFKYEGLAPLRACKQEVDAQIRSTQHLIVLTENMLTHPMTFNKERLGKIITATSHMGRIPAVPVLEELPYVTFRPPSEEIWKEMSKRISCLGCVLRMGPAQFTEITERPAGLQLKWHVVDPEYASEEQTFIVQKALGEIFEPSSPAFETVYVGPETSCFVREIPPDHRVTLRVGIQVTDTAWSVHKIAQTSIPAYSWGTNNSDYLITNSGRIATKVTQNLSTLLSSCAQFDAKYIIEFKFLEAASGTDDEGIGLVYEPSGENETLKRNGAILITPNGNIFMNGEQKLMQLPKMELGTRIVFTSELKDDETLRMTIECANKAVTYDWTVQRPLHFAARFLEPNKWNLMVK